MREEVKKKRRRKEKKRLIMHVVTQDDFPLSIWNVCRMTSLS